jgi:hypothetical protein
MTLGITASTGLADAGVCTGSCIFASVSFVGDFHRLGWGEATWMASCIFGTLTFRQQQSNHMIQVK